MTICDVGIVVLRLVVGLTLRVIAGAIVLTLAPLAERTERGGLRRT